VIVAKVKKAKKQFVLQAMLLSALRRCFRKYPPYTETLKNAKKEYYIKSRKSDKKLRRVHFKCACCGEYFSSKDIRVDHIEPVVDIKVGFVDFNTYIERLFCDATNLQAICKNDHDIKTKIENKQRRKQKNKVVVKQREKK
jgi:5-methylcytosine-specific restriction endonuclease McrA